MSKRIFREFEEKENYEVIAIPDWNAEYVDLPKIQKLTATEDDSCLLIKIDLSEIGEA